MSLDDEDKAQSLARKFRPGCEPSQPAPLDPVPSKYQQVRTPTGVLYDQHGAQIGMRVVDPKNRKNVLPRDQGYSTDASDWIFNSGG